MKKRLISLIMAIVMAATLLPWPGIAALAQELEEPSSQQHPCITTNSTGDNLRRPVPNVSLDVTEITRVASTQYSMAKGTTIVKATPSGVPELAPAVSWRDKAYAGETPVATTGTFTFDGFDSQYSDFNPNLLGVPVLT
ncbi:MAG: hypothetical protein GX824_07235, partial [Clostridiales bacterium]|nr:hypothetical protein [Clostridiales bacterium]